MQLLSAFCPSQFDSHLEIEESFLNDPVRHQFEILNILNAYKYRYFLYRELIEIIYCKKYKINNIKTARIY